MPAPDQPTADSAALALVHEGWDHLQRQQPLAAWAAWRRALQVAPEFRAATRALDVLASAADLPDAARAEYRFFTPVALDQRTRWDDVLRSRDLTDLRAAAEAFGSLAGVAGGDGRASFNQGLCCAWLGQNGAAVEALDRAVTAASATEPGVAVSAAALAEIVRQGAGAERYADDLNRVALVTWADPRGANPGAFLDARSDVRAIPHPVDPTTGQPTRPDVDLFEWLDQPSRTGSNSPPVRRLLAHVIRTRTTLRLSGPDPTSLERAVAEVIRVAGHEVRGVEREATPLPLAFLDAAIWSIRLDPGLEPEVADRLNRAAVEQYYETVWINQARHGLDGLTPLEASKLAAGGDQAMMTRLLGVVRVREQLGARPASVRLYQGYPFDRVRRRLGLEPVTPEVIDLLDPASMSAGELDGLDPAALDDFRLIEAIGSADVLGDDARTARFAARFAARITEIEPRTMADALALANLDLASVFAALVRHALAAGETEQALAWTDRARAVDAALTSGAAGHSYATWRAEILARAGQGAAALTVYRQILAEAPNAAVALDAAETMLDNGHEDEAQILARQALDIAQEAGDDLLADRAEGML